MRLRLDVALLVALLSGAATARAQLTLPQTVTNAGKQNDPLVLAGYLDATLYGADPTGQKDSTAAINAALADAMAYVMACYLPSGTYLVSDTLQGFAPSGPGNGQDTESILSANIGARYGISGWPGFTFESPVLCGPASGPRPVIKLADNAAGFGEATAPKPVLWFQLAQNATCQSGGGPYDCSADVMFGGVIRDLDLALGAGNGGAVGILFYSTQYSYVQNVFVDAGASFAGLEGDPGTDAWVNIGVQGGQFGIVVDGRVNNSQYAPSEVGARALVGITLLDQLDAGLLVPAGGGTVVSGFDIREETAPAVVKQWTFDFGGQTAGFAMLDGVITEGAGAPAAIQNHNDEDLFLENVYVSTAGALLQNGTAAPVSGSGGNSLISRYAYTDSSMPDDPHSPSTSYLVVDGTQSQGEVSTITAATEVPSDLVLRHLPGPLPWVLDRGVVSVTSFGADPTGNADSTAAIQAAVDAGAEVLLPRGVYVISATIALAPDTKLFGVPGPRSVLYAPTWIPPSTLTPLVQTANTRTGKTFVGDITFDLPDDGSYAFGNQADSLQQSYLYALDWRAGRSSIINQIAVQPDYDVYAGDSTPDLASAPRSFIHVEGNGGGRFYGIQGQTIAWGARMENPNLHEVFADGTIAPLTLYGPNFEHTVSNAMLEISGASNVRVMASKTEEPSPNWAQVEGSNNVAIYGLSGNGSPGLYVNGAMNFEITGVNWWDGAQAFPLYFQDGGIELPGTAGISLVSQGSFDETPFPHCGDGVCDGAETAANCPADCSDEVSSTSGTTGGSSSSGGTSTSGSATGRWTACQSNGAPSWASVPSFALPGSSASFGAAVQTAWDQTNLYVQVTVNDGNAPNTPSLAPSQSNAAEIYLDGTDSRAATYVTGDYQLSVSADDRAFADPDAGFGHTVTIGDGGFTVDFTVPFALLGNNGGTIGFDVQADFNPDGGAARARYLLWTGNNTAYDDPQQFGQLTLSATWCGATTNGTAGGSSSGSIGATTTGGVGVSGGCGCGGAGDGAMSGVVFALLALRRRRK